MGARAFGESKFFLFLSLYRNRRGGLGEQEMLLEHEPIGEFNHSFFEFS